MSSFYSLLDLDDLLAQGASPTGALAISKDSYGHLYLIRGDDVAVLTLSGKDFAIGTNIDGKDWGTIARLAPPGPDLSESNEVITLITAEKGDARYLRSEADAVGSMTTGINRTLAFVAADEEVSGADIERGTWTSTGSPNAYGTFFPGTWKSLGGCSVDGVGLWQRTA